MMHQEFMIPKISLMQGRLVPPFGERFQAFPALTWEKEFELAKKLNLYSIEWIYEKPYEHDNPLSNDFGLTYLEEIVNSAGVRVKSICADYYMTELLIHDGKPVTAHWDHLSWLCDRVKRLGVSYIVLPFVDQSSLKTEIDQQALVISLIDFLKYNKNAGVEIHLETDLPPVIFKKIFKEVHHPMLKMNYDTGNSASLGYDPEEEFSLLGEYLGSVHIKDRILHGGTVALGTGNTHFEACFKWFKKLKFERWYVLQAARGEKGKELETVALQIDFVKNYLKNQGL